LRLAPNHYLSVLHLAIRHKAIIVHTSSITTSFYFVHCTGAQVNRRAVHQTAQVIAKLQRTCTLLGTKVEVYKLIGRHGVYLAHQIVYLFYIYVEEGSANDLYALKDMIEPDEEKKTYGGQFPKNKQTNEVFGKHQAQHGPINKLK